MVEIRPPDAAVVVIGDLDTTAVPELAARINEVLGAGCRHVIVPVAGVTFLDASAIGTLLGLRTRLARMGCSLRLSVPSPVVLRVLTPTHALSLVD